VVCGVTDWETLALADKTTLTVNWLTPIFQPDRCAGITQKLETLPIRLCKNSETSATTKIDTGGHG